MDTANPHPNIGSGTDSAIHEAAGPELLSARKKMGDIPPGCAVSTPAFNLSAKYVIHTVGPSWVDGKHKEEVILRKAYDAALNQAAQLGCRSVAFPLMAAGSYGFPRDLALSIAISAFTAENRSDRFRSIRTGITGIRDKRSRSVRNDTSETGRTCTTGASQAGRYSRNSPVW